MCMWDLSAEFSLAVSLGLIYVIGPAACGNWASW
jgi:hypothetical protein